MKITVVVPDGVIIVDEQSILCTFTAAEGLRVLQWYGEAGHAEWVDGPNTEITYDEVQPYLEVWQQEKNLIEEDNARIESERKEFLNRYDIKRSLEYPSMADYLDGIVKGDQAQIDRYIAQCQAVKEKYPKPQ